MPTRSRCSTHAHAAPVQKDIPSEFSSCGMATGAALTFIEQLQARLPPATFEKILNILNTYFQNMRPVEQVYEEVKMLLVSKQAGGDEGNEDLVRGFQKFLPLEVLEVVEDQDVEEGEKRVVEVDQDDVDEEAGLKEGYGKGKGVIKE